MTYQSIKLAAVAQVIDLKLIIEHPLQDLEVVDSIFGRAIPKVLKMVPVATLLGAQHYKASNGFSSPNIYHTTKIASIANKSEKIGQ